MVSWRVATVVPFLTPSVPDIPIGAKFHLLPNIPKQSLQLERLNMAPSFSTADTAYQNAVFRLRAACTLLERHLTPSDD